MYPWHGLWRLLLFLTRKLLFLWVRTRTLEGQLQRLTTLAGQPVCYVVEYPGMADLAVLEQECIRHGLPRPSAGLVLEGAREWRAVAFLRRSPGRRRKGRPDRLERLAEAVQSGRVRGGGRRPGLGVLGPLAGQGTARSSSSCSRRTGSWSDGCASC
jgi:glycerol-3-phosphate O-acyltransferase